MPIEEEEGGMIEWIANEIGRNTEETVLSCTISTHLVDTSFKVQQFPGEESDSDRPPATLLQFILGVLICHCLALVEVKQNTIVGVCMARGLNRGTRRCGKISRAVVYVQRGGTSRVIRFGFIHFLFTTKYS